MLRAAPTSLALLMIDLGDIGRSGNGVGHLEFFESPEHSTAAAAAAADESRSSSHIVGNVNEPLLLGSLKDIRASSFEISLINPRLTTKFAPPLRDVHTSIGYLQGSP